ncbi:MAG: hypothetical protein COV72_06295 [Candidatus Omnitrophica bacterium CG11_big_fil_rev_8_21_14_0_20_42_13]|uniref:Transcription factor zinc-finger domain-containing protein n=1 Tax=Candidatus Ghiorseimicrobium undicola TaxID=1974746 RepID=A0A2H0LWT6_9BACT|nr:MAG: hypothetical protein COV72_06295 [Candidatus Omnitrophica bacterium CG11_big_fil_rev_8_21_14_0_20_42_13]
MHCPKCVGKLEQVKIGEKNPLVIDRCFACGGLWFDKNELSSVINKEIIDTLEFEVETGTVNDQELLKEINFDKKEIACPRCKNNRKMEKIYSVRNKKVLIDYCKDCDGIWLDAGEYNKINKRSPIEEKLEVVIDFFRLYFPQVFKK